MIRAHHKSEGLDGEEKIYDDFFFIYLEQLHKVLEMNAEKNLIYTEVP